MATLDLSPHEVRELFTYDPDTGRLRWRRTLSQRAPAGSDAGTLNRHTGYLYVAVRGRNWYVHRIAWAYTHGRWPVRQIDHINRMRADNRMANLREVSAVWNSHNTGRRVNNRSGFPGVYLHKRSGKWVAQIRADGARLFLGAHDTAEAAAMAYHVARHIFHGGAID